MNWIVPFVERGNSGAFNQNFLYQSNNVYVMDNHRAALWCWLDFYKNNIEEVSVFHLDRHSDTLQSNLDSWISQAISPTHVGVMDIQTYLNTADAGYPSSKLFRWDNYLSIFLGIYQSDVLRCKYSFYEGDAINHPNSVRKEPWDIPENLSHWLSSGKWILNIDLDYFFHKVDSTYKQMYSDEYLLDLFSEVATIAKRNSEVVVTICFSPECCGGWRNSEKVWNIAESRLNTGLILPP